MNIPAPSQQYDSYSYPYAYTGGLRQNWSTEANNGTTYDPSLDAYKQQLSQYIQQAQILLSQLQSGDPRRSQVEGYLQQAYQYAQEVGLQAAQLSGPGNEWDPLAASQNGGYGISPSYQDPTKVIYEDILPAMTADKKQTKEEHFYTPPYDFSIPGSATALATNEVDPNHPDKTRVCVTVTWPDGTVKRHYFYNVDWKEPGLTIRSTSPEHQITLDASLAKNSHVKTAEIGDSFNTKEDQDLSAINPEAPGDSPPSRLSDDGKSAVYNKEADPMITVYPDGPANNEIHASGIFTLNAYRQSDQFFVIEEGDKLVITVKTVNDKGEEKSITYTVNKNQVDQIIFGNIDDSQIDISGVKDSQTLAKLANTSEVKIEDTTVHASARALEKLEDTGVDINIFLQNLAKEFPKLDSNQDGVVDASEFEIALTSQQFPPSNPSSPEFEKLAEILAISSPNIKNIIDTIKEGNLSKKEFTEQINQITQQISTDLQIIYKAKGVEISPLFFEIGGDIKPFQISFDGQNAFALPPILAGLLAMAYVQEENNE